jgi:heterodisulfide reductase subunit A
VSEDKRPRIGVYICHCGGNISDYVDVKKVAEEIGKEGNVVVAKDVMFACSDSSQNEMVEDVKANKLDRLIVASCSPRLHEVTFRNVSERAGLNPYTYYHVNIREQSSWAHTEDREGATQKALRQVRSAVAYSRLSEPLEGIKAKSTPAVMIIGGGVAGLKAAIDLANAGMAVHLVEKEPFLGGRVPQLSRVYPRGESGPEIVRRLVHEVLSKENVVVYTNSEVDSVEGYVGNFEVKINIKPRYFKATCPGIASVIEGAKQELPNEFDYGLTKRGPVIAPPYEGAYPDIPCLDKEHCPTDCSSQIQAVCSNEAVDLQERAERIQIKVGSIIVATGFDAYEPRIGEFGYGLYKNVVTLQQLHRSIELGTLDNIHDIAFIYCVGSRQTPTPENENVNEYCSRYCCNATMNVSLSLLRKMTGLHVYHVYRDIRTYGLNELLYEQASKEGVIFLKYAEETPPTVYEKNGKLVVKVKDLLTPIDEELELPVDMVVLVTGMEPRKSNEKLYSMLKISKGKDKFLLEIHPKLKPVETAIAGVYIAGTVQAPKDISETVASAEAAASKAANIALKKELVLEPFVAQVNPESCSLNKECIQECKYDAIEIKENAGVEKAWVNAARCTGCGACVAVCPTGAIELKGLGNEQVKAMIKAMGRRG